MSASTETNLLFKRCALCAGAVTLIGGVFTLTRLVNKLWQELWTTDTDRGQQLSRAIKLEQLAVLAKSHNVNLRRSAEQLLLERVINSKSTVCYLLDKWCLCGDEEKVMKAITVVCVLVKSVDIKNLEFMRKFLVIPAVVLVQSLDAEKHYHKLSPDCATREKIQKMALCTVFEMICDFDQPKEILCKDVPNFVPCLLLLLKESTNREIMRYSLFTTHQLALHKDLRDSLVSHGAVPLVSRTVITHQGDPILQRVGLQMLVIFATTTTGVADSKEVLTSMASESVIIPTAVSLKCEEPECVYWAVALLHEFAVNEVSKEEILSVPGLMRSLSKNLTCSEANQQRLILRLLCFLGLQNDGFKAELTEAKDLIGRLPVCLASSDKEVVHWALVLTHDVAMLGKSAVSKLLNACPNLVQALVNLTKSLNGPGQRILAETLSCFASNEHRLLDVTRQGILNTVSIYAASGEPDLQFWASAVLLNMAMTSDNVKLEILKAGGLAVLNELVTAEQENTQISTMAAKTLTMLGFIDKPLSLLIECDSDLGRIEVADRTYHLDKNGLNILLWDSLTSQAIKQDEFTIKNSWDINDLNIKIPFRPQDEGNVVIVVIRGPHGQAFLRAIKRLIIFSDVVDCDKVTQLDVPPDCVCVLIGTFMSSGIVEVVHMEKSPVVQAEFQFPYGEVVNHCVSEVVLKSTIKILFSTHPCSPISKVSELELLHILARHPGHSREIQACEGFIEYLGSIVRDSVDQVMSDKEVQPIFLAHCLGALKILTVLSVHDSSRRQLLNQRVIHSLIMLLFYLTGEWINAVLSTAVSSAELLTTGQHSSDLTPTTNDQASIFALSDIDADSDTDDVIAELSPMSPLPEPPTIHHHLARSPSPTRHIHKEMSESAFTNTNADLLESQELKSGVSDLEEMFSNLARYTVLTLSNCAGVETSESDLVSCTLLLQAGALETMWSTLLCSNLVLKSAIAMPLASTLSRLSSIMLPWIQVSPTVSLDLGSKTTSLQISSDFLEVRNDSWTFESIRSTHGACGDEVDHNTEGWYYEVTLKSGGVIQIGWATEYCKFEPEKGLGVGDDSNSCAFDGGRCKVWNGKVSEFDNNDYGMEWAEGDVVSCLITKSGDMSFWLKGIDMGVAFKDLDTSTMWFPAASLSTDQRIRFNFGNTPFLYSPPNGYLPVGPITKDTSQLPDTTELPPVKDFLHGLVEEEGESHPQPSLYYEINLSSDVQKPLVYGYTSFPEWRPEGAQQVCCVIGQSILELPNGHRLQLDTGSLAPQTFGCGLVMPDGVVFFTIDGRPLKTMYAFPVQEAGQDPLLPYTNNRHLNINFGDGYFMYRRANERENTLSMAALLHDYHEIRLDNSVKLT